MGLEVIDAAFSYGGSEDEQKVRNVFEGVSFSVSKNSILCLLGPNGAGKSTLIKCLSNLQPLTQGSIRIDGKELGSLSRQEIAQKIAYVPQTHVPAFPFIVQDVVLMGRTPHLGFLASPGKNDIEIAERAMQSLGIQHLRDQRYTEISGGERQLVLLAAVLSQEPDILLLDEPTTHLDFGNQIRLLEIIDSLAHKGMAVVMSSHFPDHALLTASTVAILKEGRILELGGPGKVITEANIYRTYGVEVVIGPVNGALDLITCVPRMRKKG